MAWCVYKWQNVLINSFGKRLSVQEQMPKEGWGKKGTQVLLWQDTLPVTSNWLFGSFLTSSVVSIHPVTHSDFCSVSLMRTFSIASVLCTEPCCSTAYWANTVVCGRQMLGWGYFRRKKNKPEKISPTKMKKPHPKLASKWDKKKSTFTQVLGIQHLLCWSMYVLMMMCIRGKI